MDTGQEDVSQLSFEAALARLEEIVRTLEKGEAPLDRSIELYQEGDRLKRHCEARLKDAQMRIEQIQFDPFASPWVLPASAQVPHLPPVGMAPGAANDEQVPPPEVVSVKDGSSSVTLPVFWTVMV